jgi:hypothetical protein
MKIITTIAAAALVAGSATVALAQAGGSGSSGGTSASGGAPAAPQLDTSRPNAPPPALRRGDQMAPMQQSNVSNRMITKKKKRSTHR